jgi:hypothetical protein
MRAWPCPGTQVRCASQARLRVAYCSYVRLGDNVAIRPAAELL